MNFFRKLEAKINKQISSKLFGIIFLIFCLYLWGVFLIKLSEVPNFASNITILIAIITFGYNAKIYQNNLEFNKKHALYKERQKFLESFISKLKELYKVLSQINEIIKQKQEEIKPIYNYFTGLNAKKEAEKFIQLVKEKNEEYKCYFVIYEHTWAVNFPSSFGLERDLKDLIEYHADLLLLDIEDFKDDLDEFMKNDETLRRYIKALKDIYANIYEIKMKIPLFMQDVNNIIEPFRYPSSLEKLKNGFCLTPEKCQKPHIQQEIYEKWTKFVEELIIKIQQFEFEEVSLEDDFKLLHSKVLSSLKRQIKLEIK